jgi:hypothetical protein
MTVQQRRPLNGFHQRKARNPQPSHVTPNTRIPTTDELPEASADLAEALDRWHTLAESERAQAREAAAANAAAEQASTEYRTKVRETLAKGGDPTKVKDQSDRHKAVAKAHIEFHNDARNEREKLGWTLGPMLEAEAPALFGPIEERIEKSASAVRGSLAGVRDTWAEFSRDLEMRRWLSHVHLNGGTVGVYHGAAPLPPQVAEALAVLEDHIGALDALKADEREVQAYRDANARDAAAQRRAMAEIQQGTGA